LLAGRAGDLLRRSPSLSIGDLAEELKCWAAENAIEYSDTPAGCDTPIQKAITIAELRTGSSRFAPFESRFR